MSNVLVTCCPAPPPAPPFLDDVFQSGGRPDPPAPPDPNVPALFVPFPPELESIYAAPEAYALASPGSPRHLSDPVPVLAVPPVASM